MALLQLLAVGEQLGWMLMYPLVGLEKKSTLALRNVPNQMPECGFLLSHEGIEWNF